MANDRTVDAFNEWQETLERCPYDPTGRCNGDHTDEGGDFTSANDDE